MKRRLAPWVCALASCAEGGALPPLQLLAVEPNAAANDISVELTVTGDGFYALLDSPATGRGVVLKDTYRVEVGPTILLAVEILDAQHLRGTLPPGLAEGSYGVTAFGPVGRSARLADGLMITGRSIPEALQQVPDNRWTRVDNGAAIADTRGITDFSGMAMDEAGWRILVMGGGAHSAYIGNDVRVFDLANLEWRSLYPSDAAADLLDCAHYDTRWPGAFLPDGGLSGARPSPRATYDTLEWLGSRDQLFVSAGYGPDQLAACPGGPDAPRDVWTLDLDAPDLADAWDYRDPPPGGPAFHGFGDCAAFVPSDGRLYLAGQGNTGIGFHAYDPATTEWDATLLPPPLYGATHCTMAWAGGSHDALYLFGSDGGGPHEFMRYDLASGLWSAPNPSGYQPADGTAWGIAWDERSDVLLAASATAGECFTIVYEFAANRWTRLDSPPLGACDDGRLLGRFKYDAHSDLTFALVPSASSSELWALRYVGSGE